MKAMKVKLTFTEEVLGTAPTDKELYSTYVAGKAPDAKSMTEEIEAKGEEEVVEKNRTEFSKDSNGELILWDYQIRGFLKESIGALKQVKDKACAKCTAHKKIVDLHVFVEPRQIPIENIEDIRDCQRPLRASTPQGERTAIAVSDAVSSGAYIVFTIKYDDIAKVDLRPCIIEALKYGKRHGIGQWRNSGKGTFDYEILEEFETDE